MRNLKITLEYDGKNYAGWQAQKTKFPTIQETIEKVLYKILQEKVRLIASGRTDAGVHAAAQVANFQTNSAIGTDKLRRALNGLLPEDIAIARIEEAPLDFHSRFCAKSKTYRYVILNRPYRSALSKSQIYFYAYPLELKLLGSEAKALLGRHDFKAFSASGSAVKNTTRRIKKIVIKKTFGALITIDIEADGFLYNMVRNIVGTLIEIGRGKFPAGSMIRILRSKNRKLAGPTAPARGLTLLKVKY